MPGLYERIFPRWRPDKTFRPTGNTVNGAVKISWIGTASFQIETINTRIMIDPFYSRPSIPRLLLEKITPEKNLLSTKIPQTLDAVLCGHSHFDHLLDAPEIAKRTNALLVGSETTCMFGRSSGLLEEQLVTVPEEGKKLEVGDFEICFVPSLYNRLLFGKIPLPGEVTKPPKLPVRFWHYRLGGTFGIWIKEKNSGVSIYHNGSADLIDAALEDFCADILLVGLAGRKSTPDYLKRMMRLLSPSLIVPTHHDAFFAPLSNGVHLLPGIDLDGFVHEVFQESGQTRILIPGYEEIFEVPKEDPKETVLLESSLTVN